MVLNSRLSSTVLAFGLKTKVPAPSHPQPQAKGWYGGTRPLFRTASSECSSNRRLLGGGGGVSSAMANHVASWCWTGV